MPTSHVHLSNELEHVSYSYNNEFRNRHLLLNWGIAKLSLLHMGIDQTENIIIPKRIGVSFYDKFKIRRILQENFKTVTLLVAKNNMATRIGGPFILCEQVPTGIIYTFPKKSKVNMGVSSLSDKSSGTDTECEVLELQNNNSKSLKKGKNNKTVKFSKEITQSSKSGTPKLVSKVPTSPRSTKKMKKLTQDPVTGKPVWQWNERVHEMIERSKKAARTREFIDSQREVMSDPELGGTSVD